MRRYRKVIQLAGMVLLGVLGCKHQPDLKPPETPEVLALPMDKRYEVPARYPASEMVTDPLKQKAYQDSISPAKGGRPPGMGMGGMPPGGY